MHFCQKPDRMVVALSQINQLAKLTVNPIGWWDIHILKFLLIVKLISGEKDRVLLFHFVFNVFEPVAGRIAFPAGLLVILFHYRYYGFLVNISTIFRALPRKFVFVVFRFVFYRLDYFLSGPCVKCVYHDFRELKRPRCYELWLTRSVFRLRQKERHSVHITTALHYCPFRDVKMYVL